MGKPLSDIAAATPRMTVRCLQTTSHVVRAMDLAGVVDRPARDVDA